MSGSEETDRKGEPLGGPATAGPKHLEDCSNIEDPLRRGFCRACGMPVLRDAPFCKDHEPPVP